MDLTADGAARALGELGARPPSETTPRIDGMVPSLVFEPENASACAKAVTLCHDEGMAVVALGGATRLSLGNLPARLDAYLDTRRLASVDDHIPGDLTVAVGAGATLDALQEQLRPAGQFLPLDAPDPSRATIGGVLAAGEPGHRRRPGARPRDVLLGFEAVLADGSPIKAGGRVVKNVAGYELMKLIVGSLGTLAIVTRAFLRLRAIPERVMTLVCPVRSPEAAGDAWRKLRALPQTAEAAALLNPAAGAAHGFDDWALLLRYEGLDEEVEGASRDVRRTVKAEPTPEPPWDALRDFPVLGEGELSLRGQVEPARTFDLAAGWRDGGKLVAFPDAGLAYSHTEALDALDDRREHVSRLSGNAVLEKVPADLKAEIDVFGDTPSGLSLMRGIKQKLDPKGILSPGRFVGRL